MKFKYVVKTIEVDERPKSCSENSKYIDIVIKDKWRGLISDRKYLAVIRNRILKINNKTFCWNLTCNSICHLNFRFGLFPLHFSIRHETSKQFCQSSETIHWIKRNIDERNNWITYNKLRARERKMIHWSLYE